MNANNRPLICALRGPVTLITVGALFALNNFTPYGFSQTWPVLLIVFGLLSLLRRGTERQVPVAPPDSPAFQPYAYPPPPGTAAGGYRQTQYPPYTPPAPPRGGFGTSTPKPGEPPQTPPPGDSI